MSRFINLIFSSFFVLNSYEVSASIFVIDAAVGFLSFRNRSVVKVFSHIVEISEVIDVGTFVNIDLSLPVTAVLLSGFAKLCS